MSDLEKNKDAELLFEDLLGNIEIVEKTKYSNILSINTWFKSYVLSPEFQDLNRKEQLQVFKQKEDLEYIFDMILDYTEKTHALNIKNNDLI